MTFLQHLEEMRGRLIIVFVWLILATAAGLYWHGAVLELLILPMKSIVSKENTQFRLKVGVDGVVRMDDGKTSPTLPQAADAPTTSSFFGKLVRGILGADDATSTTVEQQERTKFPGFLLVVEEANGNQRSIEIGPQDKSQLYYFTLFTPFFLMVKAALLIGIFISLPMIVWQLWLFMSPGLKRSEKKILLPVIWSSVLLFPLGASFAYFTLSFAIDIIVGYAPDWLELRLDVGKYMSFVLTFMLVFGVLFQMPLVIVLLTRIRLVTTSFLRKNRKYAVLIILVVSAMLTPADPITMLAMGLPLVVLFEISIWAAKLVEPKPDEPDEETLPAAT